MKPKELSVFFPCVNEEGNIEKTVNEAIKVLEKLHLQYEIIIVNDGSWDKTKGVAESLAKKNSMVRLINHPQNLGYGEALKSGLYNAKYETIVYTDGDGQFDFSEVSKFINKLDQADLIIGYRIKRRDPFHRILFAKGWALTLWFFFGLTLKDVDCGFKMIKKKVLDKIPHLESDRGAMINAELAIKAKKSGFNVDQVDVHHYPRILGNPTGANIKVIINSYLNLFKLWWKLKDQKTLFILLCLILLLSVFFRFYKLDEYMTFLGDEGRDALVIKRMLVEYHFPLIGPPTSVGNIYLGPLYYYMMAVPMAVFWLNPVAAAGMVATFGVLTVMMVYYLGKIWFGRVAGLVSAFLYAISPVNIIASRSSWNPNPAPLFALLGILGIYKLHQKGNFMWLILTGISFAGALQMHYLAIILLPVGVLLWLYEIIQRNINKLPITNLISGTIFGILAFFIVMYPLVWFDLRHNFLNYRALRELFTKNEAIDANILSTIGDVIPVFTEKLIGRYITAENAILTLLVSVLVLLPLLEALTAKSKNKVNWPYLALGSWLLVGLGGLSFYRQSIYDHYLGFLNPVPYLLIGSIYNTITNIPSRFVKKITLLGFLIIIVTLAFVNLQKNPLLNSPNNQLKKTQDVAQFIIDKSSNQPFNFALLAKNNYDAAYQFYLDLYGHKPKQVPFEITDQLFIVCEDSDCNPINNPKYEVAAYGWAKIVDTYKVYGVKIYRLVPNPTGEL